MDKIKVYIAGKVNPDSTFGTHDWRDSMCCIISEKSGYDIVNIDPTKSNSNFSLNENDSELIFGRDSYMIKMSDLVIVNLTDDISVGGSQEMLIAKHFSKPLIGIAPKEGKFNKSKKEIQGKIYENYVSAFVKVPCDFVVEDLDELGNCIREIFSNNDFISKDISVIDESVKYYLDNFYDKDDYMKQ